MAKINVAYNKTLRLDNVLVNYRITYEKIKSPGPNMKTILITGTAIIAAGCIYLVLVDHF